jgi:hypothetical protein
MDGLVGSCRRYANAKKAASTVAAVRREGRVPWRVLIGW